MTKIITRLTLAGVFALGLVGAVQAQTIPTPANPTPAFPIATDGTPLPRSNVDGTFTGRSAFAPLGDTVGAGLGGVNALVDGTAGAVGVR